MHTTAGSRFFLPLNKTYHAGQRALFSAATRSNPEVCQLVSYLQTASGIPIRQCPSKLADRPISSQASQVYSAVQRHTDLEVPSDVGEKQNPQQKSEPLPPNPLPRPVTAPCFLGHGSLEIRQQGGEVPEGEAEASSLLGFRASGLRA